MDTRKIAKYTVELPVDKQRDLKMLAADTGRQIKEILTTAVTEYIDKNKIMKVSDNNGKEAKRTRTAAG